MQFRLILQWINSEDFNIYFDDLKITQDELEREDKAVRDLNRCLLGEVRLAKFEQHSSSTSSKKIELTNTFELMKFIEFCRPYVKEREETSLLLPTLVYLLSFPQEKHPPKIAEKILLLFKSLCQENQSAAIEFYLNNKEILKNYNEVTALGDKLYRVEKSLPNVRHHLEQFTEALKNQAEPLGITGLFKEQIDDTEKFAAFILWLVRRQVPTDKILQTHLLHDFLRYNFNELSSPQNPVSWLYDILEQFPEANDLIERVGKIGCGERGFLNYSLTGTLVHEEEGNLESVPPLPAYWKFSPKKSNFEFLESLFGQSFLVAAIVWCTTSKNKYWFNLLQEWLNQPHITNSQLPTLINWISKIKDPKTSRVMANLIDDSTAEQLLSIHNGAILHLLPYKPKLINKINRLDVSAYVEDIVHNDSSSPDVIMQLLALLKHLMRNKHIAADLVLETLIDILYSQTQLADDYQLQNILTRHPKLVSSVQRRCDFLYLQLNQCIEKNTEGTLDLASYNTIEDVWLNVNRRLYVLHILDPQSHSESIDKYSLYRGIAKSSIKKLGQYFELDSFIAALPQSGSLGTEMVERICIEILTAIDNESIVEQIIEKLTSPPISCLDWMTKDYGKPSIFVKAAREGNHTLLSLLTNNRQPDEESLNLAIRLAAERKHWLTVSFLCKISPLKIDSETLCTLLVLAAESGKLGILQELLARKPCPIPSKIYDQALNAAVQNDHKKVVEFFLDSYEPSKRTIEKLFTLAFSLKHFDIAEFLCSLSNAPRRLQINKAFSQAVLHNEKNAVSFLGNLETLKPDLPVVERGLKKAAEMGNVNLMKCIRRLPGYNLDQFALIQETLGIAATHNHLAVVNYLINLMNDNPPNRKKAIALTIEKAVIAGNLGIAHYLCRKSSNSELLQRTIDSLLLWAVRVNNFRVVAFFCRLPINAPRQNTFINALMEAVKQGDRDLVIHIYSRISPLEQKSLNNLLIDAVKHQQHGIFSFLYELPENEPPINVIKLAYRKAKLTSQADTANYLESKLLDLGVQIAQDKRPTQSQQLVNHGLFKGNKKREVQYSKEEPIPGL